MCCHNCGKKLRKNQPICPWCGASQDAKKPEKKKNDKASGEPQMVKLGAKGATKAKTGKKWLIAILIIVGVILLALAVTAATLFGQINREGDLSEGDIAINQELPDQVQNIALFGLDTRSNDDNGRAFLQYGQNAEKQYKGA